MAVASDATETNGYIFKGNIYNFKILYRYHNIFALDSRTSASLNQFQTLIVAITSRLYWPSLIPR